MEREFNSDVLHRVANSLADRADQMVYVGDLADCGNELGYVVGRAYKDMTEEDIQTFVAGFRHGVSLTNGKH